jgi:SAM-dependent methyltransferase
MQDQQDFQCLCCRGKMCRSFLSDVRDYYLSTGVSVDYVECLSCGLVQQHPIPANISLFYEGYPVHAEKGFVHESFRRFVLRHVYFPMSHINKNHVVLDYGCGDGWFLRRAKEQTASIIGFEPNEILARTIQQRHGVRVYADPDKLLSDWSGKVDILTLHFVLEHLTDLESTFAQWSRLLKPGGVLYAVWPNLACREYKVFGERWHGFDAPRHILFPGVDHLQPLLRQHHFLIQKTSYAAFPNTWAGSMAIRVAGHFKQGWFLFFLPLGMIRSWIDPSGTWRVVFKKI